MQKDGIRQVANDQFEVAYDPTGIQPEKFVAALKDLGYGATQNKAIGVRRDSESVELQGQSDKVGYRKGKTGKLLVGLLLTKGHSLAGAVVKVKAPEGIEVKKAETTLGGLDEPKKVLGLDFKVGKKAKAGLVEVEVTVSFEAKGGTVTGGQTVTVKIPVSIQ